MSANLALLHKLQDLDVEYKYASEWPDTDLQEVRRLANRRTERQELADNVYSLYMHGWTAESIAEKLGKARSTVSQIRNEEVRRRGLHYKITADDLDQLEYTRTHWEGKKRSMTQASIARMMGRTPQWVRAVMKAAHD